MQKRFVFRENSFRRLQFTKFLFLNIFSFFLNLVLLSLAIHILGMDPRLSQILILPILIVSSYATQRLLIFREMD